MAGPSVVAVDVGGTSVKGARFGLDGVVAERLVVPTPVPEGPAAVVRAVTGVARALADPGTTAVGVCVPGLLDTARGVVRYAPNLGLRDVPLAAAVREELGLVVALEHDVRAAGLAEGRLGAGAGVDDLLLVVLGTGIAAGLVVGGRPVVGATSAAGELGHVPVHVGGEPCACGQRGCLEVYASAGGLVRRYRRAGGADLSAAAIAAAVPTDPLAARVWAEGARALGHALVTATLLLDPALVVLAGGLTGAGEQLAAPVRASLAGGLAWREPPALRLSPLGAHAGLLGAALLALDAAGHGPAAASWRWDAPAGTGQPVERPRWVVDPAPATGTSVKPSRS